MFKRIAIVGVGLIGGSIGMAVRKRRLAGEVVGIGRRLSSIQKAVRKGAIHTGTLNLREGVRDADLVVVAAPVDIVGSKIKESLDHVKRGALIIDVSSTKEKIVNSAERIVPESVYFVGTHPIAGSEASGVLFADADLFRDTICIITPTRHTKGIAIKKAKSFWKGLGARIMIFSPEEHDRIVAKVSHLPHLLAYALCNSVSSSDIKIAGRGFSDTTRIAKSNPNMWSEIFIQNSRNLISSIEDFQRNLILLKADILRKRKKNIRNKLNQAKARREGIG